jgi:hypothetical protein
MRLVISRELLNALRHALIGNDSLRKALGNPSLDMLELPIESVIELSEADAELITEAVKLRTCDSHWAYFGTLRPAELKAQWEDALQGEQSRI